MVFLLVLSSCANFREQGTNPDQRIAKRLWYEPVPYGMAYVKSGAYTLGASGQKIDQSLSPEKTVTVKSFWIDDTEITNNEYKQFVKWVADSIAAYKTFAAGVDLYRKKNERTNQVLEPAQIDWLNIDDIWSNDDPNIKDALEPLYYSENESFRNKKSKDTRKLYYTFNQVNYKKASKRSNSYNYETQNYPQNTNRKDFILEQKNIAVYPDTLVWIRDFSYSYNEPWTFTYFSHQAFNEYPVVGVSWEQANAFCHWRTKLKEKALKLVKSNIVNNYRLPTEAEWEYAARGGIENNMYPWGGPYTSTDKGCYLANFKPQRGNYVADSWYTAKTMKVGSFDPNGYGLYDMAGNVAEWTSTAYWEASNEMVHDLNPELQYDAKPSDPPAMKRKVVRGGSWKDVSYYLQVSTRDFNYQDSARSYVGFRCVMTALEDNIKVYE